MSYLSKEVLDGLRSAERRGLGRKHRLRIQVDGETYPIYGMTGLPLPPIPPPPCAAMSTCMMARAKWPNA